MYATYVVPHQPHIPSLGYLHTSPNRLPYSMLQKLLPPEMFSHSSRRMSEHSNIRSNQCLNSTKKIRIYCSRITKVGGGIAQKNPYIVDMCKTSVSVDESQKEKGQHEEISVMSSKKVTTIYLT